MPRGTPQPRECRPQRSDNRQLAKPEVEVQVGTTKLRARARTATGTERARLWQEALKFWPPYGDYQLKSQGREIPVVVLDPIG
jgi:proline iminopeptidase